MLSTSPTFVSDLINNLAANTTSDMKKLIILLVLGILVNSNPIQAQTIVTPIGEDATSIILDLHAQDIVLSNAASGEIFIFNNAAQFNAALPSLNDGMYKLEYTLNGERHIIKFKINKNN
jgi:hypothetical protein